ncbi:hypothetical protein QO006_001895, partial [Deinococcus enclensis]|nr:hypothetical protein [Deinococcus enclensis]
MSDKRGHHEGTYQTLPDGRVRWKVRVTYPDGSSKRPSGTARTMTAARQAVRDAQTKADQGQHPVARKLTVLEMVTEYMEAKRSIWSFRSYKNNEYLLEHYIKDALGARRAAGITPRALRDYFEGLSLGSSGQNQVRSLLSVRVPQLRFQPICKSQRTSARLFQAGKFVRGPA